jgi:hypothetical protein
MHGSVRVSVPKRIGIVSWVLFTLVASDCLRIHVCVCIPATSFHTERAMMSVFGNTCADDLPGALA